MADDRPPAGDPRAFAKWFLDHETEATGVGVAVSSGDLRLECAAALLERGLVREALADANAAAKLDPRLRPQALELARRCVARELEAMRKGFARR